MTRTVQGFGAKMRSLIMITLEQMPAKTLDVVLQGFETFYFGKNIVIGD